MDGRCQGSSEGNVAAVPGTCVAASEGTAYGSLPVWEGSHKGGVAHGYLMLVSCVSLDSGSAGQPQGDLQYRVLFVACGPRDEWKGALESDD